MKNIFSKTAKVSDLGEYKKQKHAHSKLDELNADGFLNRKTDCKKCGKEFQKLSEVYVEWVGAKVPCCPHCKANMMDDQIF